MLLMNAGAAQFYQLGAERFERAKIKFLRAIIAKTVPRPIARLETVRPDDFPGRKMFDHQMIADQIESIGIEACVGGLHESLVQLYIEYDITQNLRGAKVIGVVGHATTVSQIRTAK